MAPALLLCLAGQGWAGEPPLTSLSDALVTAKKAQKTLFLQYGRAACDNCKALRRDLREGELDLSGQGLLYADVNCDDPETSALFHERFQIEGQTLPFVVIVSPEGVPLAAHTGFGSVRDYERLIERAQSPEE